MTKSRRQAAAEEDRDIPCQRSAARSVSQEYPRFQEVAPDVR